MAIFYFSKWASSLDPTNYTTNVAKRFFKMTPTIPEEISGKLLHLLFALPKDVQEKYEAEILVVKKNQKLHGTKSYHEDCLHKGWSHEGPEETTVGSRLAWK